MLSKEQRQQLDRDVLQAASERSGVATYVLRNVLDWPGKRWHRKGLRTSDVLRSCRRLMKDGLLTEAPTTYEVMKCWRPTDAGRAALKEGGADAAG